MQTVSQVLRREHARPSRKTPADPYDIWIEMQLEKHAEARVELRASLIVVALNLSRIPDAAERHAIVKRLYRDTDVPVWALHAALSFDDIPIDPEALERTRRQFMHRGYEFSRAMGVLGTVACHTEGCEGLGVEILSRSKWRDPGDPLCAACEAVREERLRIHWQKHDKRREAEVARIAAEDAEMAAILEDAGVDEELQDRLFEYLCRRHDEQNRGAGGEL